MILIYIVITHAPLYIMLCTTKLYTKVVQPTLSNIDCSRFVELCGPNPHIREVSLLIRSRRNGTSLPRPAEERIPRDPPNRKKVNTKC